MSKDNTERVPALRVLKETKKSYNVLMSRTKIVMDGTGTAVFRAMNFELETKKLQTAETTASACIYIYIPFVKEG